jgi:hypothetical protein
MDGDITWIPDLSACLRPCGLGETVMLLIEDRPGKLHVLRAELYTPAAAKRVKRK